MNNNRNAELDELFAEWRERHESENFENFRGKISKNNFIPDGIIDEASYLKSKKKILFVAKESACLKEENNAEQNFSIAQNEGFWCRNVALENGNAKKTRFSAGLAVLANALLNENFENPNTDISALRYVAFMNINKRGGFTECKTDLSVYVDKYKDLIDREIRIISPDFVVCCGIGLKNCLLNVDSCKSLPVLEVYHPSYWAVKYSTKLKKLEEEFKNIQRQQSKTG